MLFHAGQDESSSRDAPSCVSTFFSASGPVSGIISLLIAGMVGHGSSNNLGARGNDSIVRSDSPSASPPNVGFNTAFAGWRISSVIVWQSALSGKC